MMLSTLTTSRNSIFRPCSRVLGAQFPNRSIKTSRCLAKKKKKGVNPFAEKKKKKVVEPYRWTFENYVNNKDPNISYADEESAKWNIIAAMIVHRTPRVEEFAYSWEIEVENMEEEISKKRDTAIPIEYLRTAKEMVEDGERVFEPLPRWTDEDYEENTKSVHRRLGHSLYLIVKTKQSDGSELWDFPQADWVENETIRETGERMITEQVCDLATYLLGNNPIMHLQNDETSTKVFYMHNVWLHGAVNVSRKANAGSPVVDWAWVTKYEMKNYMSHKPELLSKFEQVFYST